MESARKKANVAAADKSFVISNEGMRKALKTIKDIVSKNPLIPILEHVMFKVNGDSVTIIASDLEVTALVEVAIQNLVKESYDFLMPFDLLSNISNLTGDMPLTIHSNANSIKIEAAFDLYELGEPINPDEFPKAPAFPSENQITISDDFPGWVNKALATVSTDKLRPAMTKVCIDIEKGKVTVVSTDASSMFCKSFDADCKIKDRLLMSAKVAKAINGLSEISLFWNDGFIAFKEQNLTLYATRSNDGYPNYKSVIPDNAANIFFDRAELLRAIEKAALTSGGDKAVAFKLKELIGTIKIESHDNDKARHGIAQIAADYTGDCDIVSVSADLMSKLLLQIPFGEVGISFMNPNKAVLISSPEDETYTGLVMPIMSYKN